MASKRDYYEILGVDKKASEADIKAAYRKMALKWHPDRNADNKKGAEEKFKEINEAYQVLSDKQKKQSYDQFGHAAFENGGGGGAAGNPFAGGFRTGPFQWSYQSSSDGNPFEGFGGDAGFGDPFDIFEQFFGGSAGGFNRQRKPRYSLRIEFMEAVKGVEKTVVIQGKEHKIKIPAGASEGVRIQFDDFEVTIDVKPDARFTREGNDLFIEEDVPLVTAIIGGEIEVPTVNNPIKMKVKAGTQPNSLVRLRGEGVPHLRGHGKGDLYIRLKVKIPERLTGRQRELLRQFDQAS
ncbi:MAG: J domain-containing protein [Patescibacteria group bacterium]